ncbi:MAG: SCO family protein, partial [Marinirhabdus sp.]
MRSFFSKYKPFIIVMAALSGIIVSVFYSILKPRAVLPIYQPADVTGELVDSTLQHKKKYHTIGDFSLTNQNGKTVTQN